MKITVVDGSEQGYKTPEYSENLIKTLSKKGHDINLFKLKELTINYCTGCWSCWWKTPGLCIHNDDMPILYKSYMESDLVIHFSTLRAGFISSKLKTVNDRSVALVLPYIELVNGECHHKKRYQKYPAFGLIIDDEDADKDDIEITKELYQRMTLNFKSELKFLKTTQNNKEEISHAISHI